MSGFFSAPHWARLGGGTGAMTDVPGNYISSYVEQSVQIPAAPAILRFMLRVPPSGAGVSYFYVMVSGQPILQLDSGSATYTPVQLDLSAYAGGPRMLRFHADSANFSTLSPSWEVDDVSLDAPDPPASPGPATAPTGRRAAALARCKRKHGKARRACKRRARLLPL
jgi:hypothetical protein